MKRRVVASLLLAMTAMPPLDARELLWPGLFSRRNDPHAIAAHARPADPAAPCRCRTQRIENGWCARCNLGHVAGVALSSQTLYDFLDAHGHAIDPARMTCRGCREALRADGFCDICGWGFVGGLLYFTELTYRLARGTPASPADRPCRRLRTETPEALWCGGCGIGVVGSVLFTQRAEFDAAARQFARLQRAVAIAERCDLCAVVLFTGAECPRCSELPDGSASP